MNTTGTKKRTYDEQFKRDAVALLEGGRKATQLAHELGNSSLTCAIRPSDLAKPRHRFVT